MPRNPAREALSRAVNRAIAEGAPVYVNQPAATPASFWSYHAATATPSYDDAIACGAISADRMTEESWQSLTPGMRREIVRTHLKKAGADHA